MFFRQGKVSNNLRIQSVSGNHWLKYADNMGRFATSHRLLLLICSNPYLITTFLNVTLPLEIRTGPTAE
jgi:hypothetical protein